MIKKRYFEMVNLIMNSNNEITVRDIADLYSITERSVRYDVNELNIFFNRKGKKNLLEISNNKLRLLCNRKEIDEIIKRIDITEYLLNEEERVMILAYEIFLLKDRFILQYFTEKYGLSKTTIRNSLKELNQIIGEYSLVIELDNNKGYKITGDEINIRKYMINILRQYLKTEKDETLRYTPFTEIIRQFLSEKEVGYAKTVIKRILTETGKTISDEAFETLQLFLIISRVRSRMGFRIEEDIENRIFLSKTTEFSKIAKILDEIKNIEEQDIYYFVDFFLGSYSYNTDYSYFLNWILMESLIEQLIRSLSDKLGIDFTKDMILRKELTNHLKPAIYRMKNKLKLTESILKEVKESYADLYYKTWSSLEKISDFINIPFDEDEAAFITVMIQRAVIRNTNVPILRKIPNILIVCGLGYSSSRFLYENISNRFQVNIIDIIPFNQLENYNYLKKADIVISTLAFNLEGIDVINVNPIMNENDIVKLRKYGLEERKNKIKLSELVSSIRGIFDEEKLKERLIADFGEYIYDDTVKSENWEKGFINMISRKGIILNADVSNMDEFIIFIGQAMIDAGLVKEGYVDELKNQVNQYGKYIMIGEKTILPHGQLLKNVKKTGFSLITLRNGVDFLGSEVRIAICLASRNKEEHLQAILELNRYMKIPDFEDELLSKINSEEIIEYLKSLKI